MVKNKETNQNNKETSFEDFLNKRRKNYKNMTPEEILEECKTAFNNKNIRRATYLRNKYFKRLEEENKKLEEEKQ